MEINREKLAWAAGFADGEAHFGIVKTTKTGVQHIHIQICQTEDGPLQRFQKAVGTGKIYGPYNPKKAVGGRKSYKQFHLDKFELVQQTICMLWPWLSTPKKDQIKRMLHNYLLYAKEPNLKTGPKPQPSKTASCHPARLIKAKGLCNPCYRKALSNQRYHET